MRIFKIPVYGIVKRRKERTLTLRAVMLTQYNYKHVILIANLFKGCDTQKSHMTKEEVFNGHKFRNPIIE